ncbi:stage II sporulation protein R [Neobacillus vireti]|uniref:Stage II sporulation protein R n=1 Tax=Neobacillus vireti LMG 21834 TaxID=1131730 RepID=A0AB94IHM3_9BACI|nr:stage II sporulation protein R [Neobacillus vireti]ETI66529.1 stage II sporulation protein R [Neobacillus vireti LMG 21834]KLT16639.1 stage II sporulation protein R [Neobacillus vireti]
MRSKLAVWGYLIVLSFATMLSLYMPKTEAAQKESIVIPGEAIRLRILANSDFETDQAIKRKVRDAVNAQITLWVQDLTSMEKARTVINAKLPEIQAIAEKVVLEEGADQPVKVEFAKVQFPTKLYGQYLYPAGKYQAILITLGSGEGANWWCVLYPPLCFLDFSNGDAVSEGFDEKQKTAKAGERDSEKVEGAPEKAKKDSEEVEMAHEKASDVEVMAASQPAFIDKERVTEKSKVANKPALEKKQPKKEKAAPVYTVEDEAPVKVKFFVVEMWEKIFY